MARFADDIRIIKDPIKIVHLTTNDAVQTLTGAWANLGSPISFEYEDKGAIWLKLDVNDSLNVRVRVLAQLGSGATSYVLPIETVSASDVKVEDDYTELNDDADQNIILGFSTDGIIPYVQIQVMAGTAGAAPGTVVGIITKK